MCRLASIRPIINISKLRIASTGERASPRQIFHRMAPAAEEMTPAAVELLKQGVALDVKAWLANVDADAQGRAILEQFLQRDDVLTHPVWKEHFQAWPPRGVVARLARRLNVSLSLRAGFYNFAPLQTSV